MDRVYSQDDRIRRAEEIYARRQNMRIARERTRRATVNVNNKPRNFRLFKKLILQIIICILIYFIFYLINTTSYSFSDNVLEKTRNLLSYDNDFYGMYSATTKSISDFFNKSINQEENGEESPQNVDENSNQENNEEGSEDPTENMENADENTANNENTENNENVGNIENNANTEDESLTQTEIAHTEESDIERVKHTYSFGLPVSRLDNVRIWR